LRQPREGRGMGSCSFFSCVLIKIWRVEGVGRNVTRGPQITIGSVRPRFSA
jgi:hypothetical protein